MEIYTHTHTKRNCKGKTNIEIELCKYKLPSVQHPDAFSKSAKPIKNIT